MSYQALYRKWRPIDFEDVVGQNHITQTLKTELVAGKVAHAYLFCGTRGTGKTTTAKILSRAVNCESLTADGNPCNKCKSCQGILNGSYVDVVEIDAASNNGVESIRELRDEVVYTPVNVKIKVYIIDEVHMLSTEAFNALLKTLEEPPSHVLFILATTEPQKIPATIRSRCQRFDFKRISTDDIAGRLGEVAEKDGFKITADALRTVAEIGNGSMRDALSVLDLCSGVEGEITKEDIENLAGTAGSTNIFGICSALASYNAEQALEFVLKALKSGVEVGILTDGILACIRDILICKTVKEPSKLLDKSNEDMKTYKTLSENAKTDFLLYAVRVLSDTLSMCKTAVNPKVLLEAAIIKICNPESETSLDALNARIAKLESMIKLGNFTQPAVSVKEEPKQESALQEENLPWETEAPPVEEVKVPEYVEGPETITETVTEELPVQQEEKSSVSQNAGWNEIIDALMIQDMASASLLVGTENKIENDVFYVIFKNKALAGTASNNKSLMDMLNSVSGGRTVRITTVDDEKNKKVFDPFDELIEKSKGFDGTVEII